MYSLLPTISNPFTQQIACVPVHIACLQASNSVYYVYEPNLYNVNLFTVFNACVRACVILHLNISTCLPLPYISNLHMHLSWLPVMYHHLDDFRKTAKSVYSLRRVFSCPNGKTRLLLEEFHEISYLNIFLSSINI